MLRGVHQARLLLLVLPAGASVGSNPAVSQASLYMCDIPHLHPYTAPHVACNTHLPQITQQLCTMKAASAGVEATAMYCGLLCGAGTLDETKRCLLPALTLCRSSSSWGGSGG